METTARVRHCTCSLRMVSEVLYLRPADFSVGACIIEDCCTSSFAAWRAGLKTTQMTPIARIGPGAWNSTNLTAKSNVSSFWPCVDANAQLAKYGWGLRLLFILFLSPPGSNYLLPFHTLSKPLEGVNQNDQEIFMWQKTLDSKSIKSYR